MGLFTPDVIPLGPASSLKETDPDHAVDVMLADPADVQLIAGEPVARHLSEAERSRAEKFRADADRHAYIVAHALTRYLLARRLGCRPPDLEFTTEAAGRPVLAAPYSERLTFSLSRRRNLVACALASGCPIGIDIERIDAVGSDPRFLARFVARETMAALSALPPGRRERALAQAWTVVEAHAKATGRGLDFRAPPIAMVFGVGTALEANFPAPPGPGLEWHATCLTPRFGHCGAVVIGIATKLQPCIRVEIAAMETLQ